MRRLWFIIAILGAAALGTIALRVAGNCSVAATRLRYRFYSMFISVKVLVLDAQRARPPSLTQLGGRGARPCAAC